MQQEKRLKILFITKWFINRHDPQLGVFIRKHASAAALFCDVSLLFVMSDEKMKVEKYEWEIKNEYNVNSVVVYFRKSSSKFFLVDKIINMIRYCIGVRKGLRLIRKKFGKHDITHAYIMLRPALVAYIIKLFSGKPFIISEQWSGYATGEFEEKNFIVKMFWRFIFKRANAVTVVSKFLKSNMEKTGLKNNYVITPNIIEQREKKSSPLSENGKLKILVVADLVDEIKNISGIFSALAEVVKTESNVEMHIIGRGKDRTKLEMIAIKLKLLNSFVFFHGVKSNEEVFDYLHACDFLVVNSNFETFSLICVEAMCCGKPVIATRCGGPQEFVTDETGILIEPKNNLQLIEAMKKMIHQHKNFSPEKLKKYATEKFGAEKTGKIFFNIYSALAQKR